MSHLNSQKMIRTSFTLPPAVLEDLSYLSGRLGVSRSAFVSELLGRSVGELRGLLEGIPEDPTEADILRFRGRSESVISARVESVRRMGNDLLSDV